MLLQKKDGFTMIELIFVIVIIGILASISISRLSLTREDAKAVVCMDSIKLWTQDLSNYYTANGKLDKLSVMTHVPVNVTIADRGIGTLQDDDLSISWSTDFVCDGGYLATIKYETNGTDSQLTLSNAAAINNPLSLNNSAMVINNGRVANIAGEGLQKVNFWRTITLGGSTISF